MAAGKTEAIFPGMPPLTYPVKVALSGYYPVGPTNVKVNQGLPTTKSFPLVAVETNDNALRGLRHIVVDSVPDEASVIINGADSMMVTHAEKDVAPGDYDIYVIKDGYKNSVTKHITIPGYKQENARCSPVSVKVNFDLVQNTDVTASKALIIPQPLNIARPDSYLLAFVTLPTGVKAADVVDGKVWCQDAPALKLYRLNTFPQTFAAVFRRGDLVGVSTGKRVPMKIWGVVRTSDGSAMFSAGTNVEVINKKNSPKEDIDNVLKWTALEIFKFFK